MRRGAPQPVSTVSLTDWHGAAVRTTSYQYVFVFYHRRGELFSYGMVF